MEKKENNFIKIIQGTVLILILLGTSLLLTKTIKAQESGNNLSELRILYQGILNNSDGTLAQDQRYNVKFKIYDDKETGNVLWEEEHAFYDAVFVKDGKFKIILGRKTPLNLNLNQPSFWLGLAIGKLDEENNIKWEEEMKPRKLIISLSELLKEEGLEALEQDGLTEEEWNTIFDLIDKKFGDQPDLVVLFDTSQLKNLGTVGGQTSSKLFDVLKDLITFISDKISQILEEVSKIRDKIELISVKLEGMSSILADMKFKIDTLYNILVVDKGLAPVQPEKETNYSEQRIERMIFKGGESSLRIFNDKVKENSLIFISFLEDPGESWWISEKVPGYSFVVSFKSPREKDLVFDYWILNEESGEGINQPSVVQETGNTEQQGETNETTNTQSAGPKEETGLGEENNQASSTEQNAGNSTEAVEEEKPENPTETSVPEIEGEQSPLIPESPPVEETQPENPEG